MTTSSSSKPSDTQVVARLIVMRDDNLLRQIPVEKERMVFGRRPYCDVILDDLTVSGEHALLHTRASESILHDLNSRNGTLVNGIATRQQVMVHGDMVDIGVFKVKFVHEQFAGDATRLMIAVGSAKIKVLNGKDAGVELALDRAITSVGSNSQIAVVARRRNGYYLTHMEGPSYPLVNGESIGLTAQALVHNDLIELAGNMFQFVMSA